jgi:Holliday junction resolvase RusA-like endonuclease
MNIVALPWPDSNLNPNKRVHWAVKSRAVKSYRSMCAEVISLCEWNHTKFEVVLYPPDKRRRDVDNVIASCKAMIDGISDATGVDDSEFEIMWPSRLYDPVEGGRIVIKKWGRTND